MGDMRKMGWDGMGTQEAGRQGRDSLSATASML